MVDDDSRASAEPSSRPECIRTGANNHVNVGSGYIVEFGQTATSTAKSTDRETFVKDETIFVFDLQLNLPVLLEGKEDP
jgi:hypothetical protein